VIRCRLKRSVTVWFFASNAATVHTYCVTYHWKLCLQTDCPIVQDWIIQYIKYITAYIIEW